MPRSLRRTDLFVLGVLSVAVVPFVAAGCAEPAVEFVTTDRGTGEEPSTEQAASELVVRATDATPRSGEDWPLFLGPRETGVADAAELIDDLNAAVLTWSKPLGSGYTAPSILGDRCLLFHREGDDEILECVHPVTAQTQWTVARPSDFRDPYGYSNGPRCTPQIHADGGYCITFGATGRLMRVDLESGRVDWEVQTAAEFDVPEHFFGVGCTPILETVGDRTLVITLVGGQPNAGVVAFDAADGSVVWQSVGKQTWDGAATRDRRGRPDDPYAWTGSEMVVSYSSPIAATIGGQRHVLCLMRQGLVSLDPADGRERFHFWHRSPIHESVNASRPVVVDDTILLSAPYNAGCVRLRVDGDTVTELWRTQDEFDTHFATAIYHQGHYYGFHGRHEAGATMTCIDAETGTVRWASSGFEGDLSQFGRGPRGQLVDAEGRPVPHPFYGRGSAILVGDRFLVLGERGTLAWVEANAERFVEQSRIAAPDIEYPSWPAPVLVRGRVYLRDNDTAVCLDLAKPESPATSASQPAE